MNTVNHRDAEAQRQENETGFLLCLRVSVVKG